MIEFLLAHPGTVVSWLILGGVVGYLVLKLIFEIWAEREERRQQAQAERLDRLMSAHQEPGVWPHRGKKGFQQGQGER